MFAGDFCRGRDIWEAKKARRREPGSPAGFFPFLPLSLALNIGV